LNPVSLTYEQKILNFNGICYDASIIFPPSNTTELNSNIYTGFETINTWFKNSHLSLNFEKKTRCIHSKTMKSSAVNMATSYNNKLIPNVLSTKFLGLTTDGTLSWRMHRYHLTTK
jgi:hypothetical protein